MDSKDFLDIKEQEDLKLKDDNEFIPLKGLNETSIFTNGIKKVFQNNYNDKIYINTENNIISVKDENSKRNHKIFNLKNYERIFKKNREKNFFTLKEENNAEIIKHIFDIIKTKNTKKEASGNRTISVNKLKNNLTKYKIYKTLRNPNEVRKTEDNLDKSKDKEISSNISYEQDYIKNKTIAPKRLCLYDTNPTKIFNREKRNLPYIKSLKNELTNLDMDAKKFNQNITTLIKFRKKESIKDKNNFNITLLKPNKLTLNHLDYNEVTRKKKYIENKKYINRYIKKLNNFKYNNELINKFLKRKKDNFEKILYNLPQVKKKIELEDDYYYLRKKPKINQIPVLRKFNIIKKRFGSKIDEDIFNVFNKKI